jgi:hypothetical protein
LDFLNLGDVEYDYSRLMQLYCSDLNYIADLIAKLSGSYNLMTSSAEVTNRIALARKDDVQDAIDRAQNLGKVIDRLIAILGVETSEYIGYVKMKNDFFGKNFAYADIIKAEIDHHIIKVHDNDKSE